MNEVDLEWDAIEQGDSRFRRKTLGRAAGGQSLGSSLYEIPPGGRDWPYHFHHGNEEAVYVLAGEGVLQSPDGEKTVRAGDYLAFPIGERSAHRFHNRSDGPLRFLCISTMIVPEVVEYPEIDRLGVFCGSPPGGDREARTRHGYYASDARVPYWDQ